MIPIYQPYLPPNSLKYAHEALDSTWLSSQGKYIQMVQEKLQELLNVKYVLPVNNGTSACHLLAKSVSEKYSTDENYGINEIIVPNNVYAAAWNGFLFDSNYDLLAIDADLDTWNYDLKQLDWAITVSPKAAVLIVHNVGNIINVPELKRRYPNTVFVEDNCEGFLGKYENQYSGTASFASAISFFGNKNITSGEGGAFITNDEETYQFAKVIHAQGQSKKRFVHDHLGYNYRITNIQAAILYGQLEILPEIIQRKQDIFGKYRAALQNREDILIQKIADQTEHANWMFGVRVPDNQNYDATELYFRNVGIEIRPMFYPISAHAYLNDNWNVKWTACTNAELLNKECFILPSYPDLSDQEQTHILQSLERYLEDSK
jgi:perosamine synthetase